MQVLVLADGSGSGQLIPPIAEIVPELTQIAAQQQALRGRCLSLLEIYAAQLK